MKIAVTATEPSLEAAVDPRFGRCPCFLIVETDSMTFEAVENPNVTLGGGAGIQSAQLMAEKGVQFVLTGNCGPNAYSALGAAGIGVIVGCSGSARDIVERFKAGGFETAGGPNVASKFGTGQPAGTDQNQATGRQAFPPGAGMGMGMGRGMGMGPAFQGVQPVPPARGSQGMDREQEMELLKQQAQALSEQMRQIQERIRQLEQEG